MMISILRNPMGIKNILYAMVFLSCSRHPSVGIHIESDLYYPVSGMRCIGEIKPLNSFEIAASPWGIQTGTMDEAIIDKAAEIGVKWTRLQISWPSVEKEKGVYNWEKTDEGIEKALEMGITPFVTIGSGNKLYSRISTYEDPKLAEIYGYKPEPPTKNPQAVKAWLSFVKAAVERYQDKIKFWEIWNEPNHRNYWGAEPDGQEYGRLVLITAKHIREVYPDASIIAGSMAGIDPEFTEDFLSTGTSQLIDIISYHNYGAIPEERIYPAEKLWEVIKKYSKEIELWQGECGYPSHSSTRDFRGISPWGLNIQSKWLLRQAFTDVFFCRAKLSNYFKLFHEGGRGEIPERTMLTCIDSILGYPERDGSRVKTVGVNEKCLLSNPGLEPKPALAAYRNLCAIFDSRYNPFILKHDISVIDAGMFYGVGPEDDAFPSVPLVASFQSTDNNRLIAYWLPWHPQEYTPRPARIDLNLTDCSFNEPVLVNLLDGKVYQIEEFREEENIVKFRNIPLFDFPLVIMEMEEVRLH